MNCLYPSFTNEFHRHFFDSLCIYHCFFFIMISNIKILIKKFKLFFTFKSIVSYIELVYCRYKIVQQAIANSLRFILRVTGDMLLQFLSFTKYLKKKLISFNMQNTSNKRQISNEVHKDHGVSHKTEKFKNLLVLYV